MKSEKITERHRWYDDACGAALALEFVGERWALLVMRELLLGPRRFGEMRAGLPGISANVLTQRLAGLEASGIVRREAEGRAQLYALTDWGRESEGVILSLGRWALRSPAHDPTLFFSPVSLVLALKMLLVPERVADFAATVVLVLRGEAYHAVVAEGAVAVARGRPVRPDATITGDPSAFLPVLFGGMPLSAAEAAGMLAADGNRDAAERFVTLFRLPEKVAP